MKPQSFFEQAIEPAPLYPDAWSSLAFSHARAVTEQWTPSPARSLAELQRAARRCVSLDPQSALGHTTLAFSRRYSGRLDEALGAAERHRVGSEPVGGLQLPRYDPCFCGSARRWHRQHRNGMMWFSLQQLAAILLAAERFAEAADAARRSIQRNPDTRDPHALLAVSYAHLGRLEEARSEFREALRLQPDYFLGGVEQVFEGANEEFVELVIDGLRKVGLEE